MELARRERADPARGRTGHGDRRGRGAAAGGDAGVPGRSGAGRMEGGGFLFWVRKTSADVLSVTVTVSHTCKVVSCHEYFTTVKT